MKQTKGTNMTVISILGLALMGTVFAAAPTVPGIQDFLAVPFATLFTQVASLVLLLNLLGAAARHWLKFEGPTLYFSIVGAGLVLGAIGQLAGLLTVVEYATLPSPMGGVAFGFTAALQAVGLNQGKRVVTGTSPAPNTPPTKPDTTLPPSG
jgi:hypothetical protein